MIERVGVIVFTTIPGDSELVAVLHDRGRYNAALTKPKLWAGGTQPTSSGKIKEDENPLGGILREASEELGETFAMMVVSNSTFTRIFEDETTLNYGVVLEHDRLDSIELCADSGGLRYVRKEDLPRVENLREIDSAVGVPDRRRIAMFNDDKEALIRAFELFSPEAFR